MVKLIPAIFHCAGILALFLVNPILWAQFETATLTGSISDPQSAVIPKASVKLTNEATNAEFSAVTDERWPVHVQRATTRILSTGCVSARVQAVRIQWTGSSGEPIGPRGYSASRGTSL